MNDAITERAKKRGNRHFAEPWVILPMIVEAIQTGKAQQRPSIDPTTQRYEWVSPEGRVVARWAPETGKLVDVYKK